MPQNTVSINPIEVICQTLLSLLENTIATGGNLITALAILLIGWIIAFIVSKIFYKVLKAINVEKLMDKIKEVDLFAGLNFSLVKGISKFLFWMIFIVFLMKALDILGLQQVTKGISTIIGYLPSLITAIVFFVVGAMIANLIRAFISSTTESIGVGSGKFIAYFVYYFLLIMVSIISLEQAGLQTDILTENLQIILALILGGLALGFGLSSRDLLSNILGGFYTKNKFEVGQDVEIDNNRGKISDIDSTSLTLDLGDKSLVIPLNQVAKSNVIVHS